MTILYPTDKELIRLLQQGAVGLLPTDTIYGLVARAEDQEAVRRLYRIKHREGKPGTVIAATHEQLQTLGIAPHFLQQVMAYWPNPISIVLPAPPSLAYLDQGKQSLAVRIPHSDALQALLEKTGPLLTSSANLPGQPPASSLAEAQAYFGEELDFYVDGGTMTTAVPSTVARLKADGGIEVLRQGAVALNI